MCPGSFGGTLREWNRRAPDPASEDAVATLDLVRAAVFDADVAELERLMGLPSSGGFGSRGWPKAPPDPRLAELVDTLERHGNRLEAIAKQEDGRTKTLFEERALVVWQCRDEVRACFGISEACGVEVKRG